MNKNLLYVGKGKRNASPIFCFSASCSNLVSMGSDKLSTERPVHTALLLFKGAYKHVRSNDVLLTHHRASW